jgi:hypothetical protein
MLTVRVPLAVRKPRGGRKLILTPSGMVNRGTTAADTTLVKALARAFRCKRSPQALLALRVTSMVLRPEARSFRPALWSTQMTTRRRKFTAVWKY